METPNLIGHLFQNQQSEEVENDDVEEADAYSEHMRPSGGHQWTPPQTLAKCNPTRRDNGPLFSSIDTPVNCPSFFCRPKFNKKINCKYYQQSAGASVVLKNVQSERVADRCFLL